MLRYLIPFLSLTVCFPALNALEGVITFEALEAKVNALEARLNEICSDEEGDECLLSLISAQPQYPKWFVHLDILYWQPRVGGTAFAYTNSIISTQLPLQGRTRKLDFGWDWGVRAGIGHLFCHDDWDVDLTYTYYQNHDSKSATAGFNSTVIPLKGSIAVADGVGLAKSQFDVDFQSLDLDLGRFFYISGKCSLRPFIGLKSAWIDLEQTTRYTGGSFLGVRTASVKDESDFWGLGPLMGLNTLWNLRDGFSFKGNISGALLYGNFDVHHKERLTSTPMRIKLADNDRRLSPMVDLYLALQYGRSLQDDDYYLTLALGYEMAYFWRQNQMLQVYEYDAYRYQNISEDLGLRGVTLRAALYF